MKRTKLKMKWWKGETGLQLQNALQMQNSLNTFNPVGLHTDYAPNYWGGASGGLAVRFG